MKSNLAVAKAIPKNKVEEWQRDKPEHASAEATLWKRKETAARKQAEAAEQRTAIEARRLTFRCQFCSSFSILLVLECEMWATIKGWMCFVSN